MFRRWWSLLLLAALAAAPRGASGQCGMMGGGGHEHGSESAPKKAQSDKKVRQAVRQALADESGRQALLEEILADADFVRALAARIAGAPEWRAFMETALAGSAVPASPPGLVAVPRNVPSSDTLRLAAPPPGRPEAAVYRCPMHSEVTSSVPGQCPKCGMTLRRDS